MIFVGRLNCRKLKADCCSVLVYCICARTWASWFVRFVCFHSEW